MANDPAARMRRARTKKGLHPTMKAFYFLALFQGLSYADTHLAPRAALPVTSLSAA
jgi:hypothetical protein